MKRAFPQKVKPVPSCAADSNLTAGDIKQVLSGPRKVRTSAAMIGLAISMGASTVLLPQQGDGAATATEPKIAADTTSAADPKASASEATLASQTTEEAGVQTADKTPEPSALEPQVQQPQTFGIQAESELEQTPEIAPFAPHESAPTLGWAENPTLAPVSDRGTGEGEFTADTATGQKTDVTLSESYGVDASTEAPSVELSGTQRQPLAPGDWIGTPDVNSQLRNAEGIESAVGYGDNSWTGNRLQWQVEEFVNPTETTAPSAAFPDSNPYPSADFGTAEVNGENPTAPQAQVTAEETNLQPFTGENRGDRNLESEAIVGEENQNWMSPVNPGQPLELNSPAAAIERQPISEQWQPSVSAEGETTVPASSALAEPDMTGAIEIEAKESNTASRIYQVNPGDTLGAIAKKNGISTFELIQANQLVDPDLIEVDRKIKIPLPTTNNPVGQTLDSDPLSENTDTGSAVKTDSQWGTDESLSETQVAVVEPQPTSVSSTSTPSTSTPSTPTFPLISPLTPSEAIGSISEASISQIDRDADMTSGPQNFSGAIASETLADSSVANETASSSGSDLDGLRSDIIKLREKYREQEALGQHNVAVEAIVQPSSDESTEFTAAPTITQPASDQASESEAFPIPVIGDNRYREESVQARIGVADALENRYVDSLRAEIEKLREKYRTETPSFDTEPEATQPVVSETRNSPRINPQFNPAPQTEPVQRQSQSSQTEPAQVVAVAPLGSETYAPLVQPQVGQMVSPELPPLKTPDNYLPDSVPRFNGYIWPAEGLMTSGYGWRWGRMHKGIDIAGPIGTPIYAAAPGTIVYAGWNSGGYGNLVEIEHPDGSVTLYAHNHRIMVQEGQTVQQGQQVAEMGSTGFSTGPHLHFEIHTAGQGAVNPMAYLPAE